MSNFKDESLYSKGLAYYKKNQLDNCLDHLIKIKKKKFKYPKINFSNTYKEQQYKKCKDNSK